jgi:protease-4
MQNFQAKELLEKLGLKYSVIKSGKYKDIGSPTREMSPEEKALIQGVVDDIYKQFLEVVATGRKIPKEKLKGIAEGKIFTGRQALDLGLVDEIGDMKRSIDIAAKLAGIKGEPDVVYIKEERKSLLKYIASGMASAVLESLKEDEGSTVNYLYKSAL